MGVVIYRLDAIADVPKKVAHAACGDEVIVACPTPVDARRFGEAVRRAGLRCGITVTVRGQHTRSLRFTATSTRPEALIAEQRPQ